MPLSRQKPARLLKKRRKRLTRRFVLSVLAGLLLVILPALIARLSFWQIEEIAVSGSRAVPDALIRDRTREAISGSYLGIYPRGNILLFSKNRIEKALLEDFPRLLSASVDIQNLRSITVSVEEREPEFLWCNDAECFFLDIEGYIFDKAPEFTGSVYVSFFGELSPDATTVIGEQFLEEDEFMKLSLLVSGLKDLSLEPATVHVIADKEYEITLAGGETLLVATIDSVESTLTNVRALLVDPKLSLRSGSQLSFQTLDLRYGNKVFFVKKGD